MAVETGGEDQKKSLKKKNQLKKKKVPTAIKLGEGGGGSLGKALIARPLKRAFFAASYTRALTHFTKRFAW